MSKIDSFSGKYDFLSNFYPSEIHFDGKIWPTVEHAYQAFKTIDDSESEQIRNSTTPGIAKRLGQKVSLRDDWDEIKDNIMFNLVEVKFKIPELRKKLLETDDAELIEGNYWNDTYWGVCRGKGKNKLGKILMDVRSSIIHDHNFE